MTVSTALPTVDDLIADILPSRAESPASPQSEERCEKTWLIKYSCSHCTSRWGEEPVGGRRDGKVSDHYE